MPLLSAPLPHRSPLIQTDRDPSTGRERLTSRITSDWLNALEAIVGKVDRTEEQVAKVRLTAQAAAIAATPVHTVLSAGLYRISYFVRVTQAASVSSSVQVTIGFTDGGVAVASAGTAQTGNTTATHETRTLMVRADQATAITLAVAYASAGGTPMTFAIDVVVEAIG